jgi:hypothetical protein
MIVGVVTDREVHKCFDKESFDPMSSATRCSFIEVNNEAAIAIPLRYQARVSYLPPEV